MTPESDHRRWVGKRPRHARRHLAREIALRSRLPDHASREVVLRNVPLHSYSAGRKTLTLARGLRAVDPSAPVDVHRGAFDTWYDLAADRITAPRADAWAAFERAYRSARCRPGAGLDAAMAGVSVIAEVIERMARLLGRAWFISCRKLGEWLGVSHETARRRLLEEVAAGRLRRLIPGTRSATRREAATYHVRTPFDPRPNDGGVRRPSDLLVPHLRPSTTPADTSSGGGGLPCVNPTGVEDGETGQTQEIVAHRPEGTGREDGPLPQVRGGPPGPHGRRDAAERPAPPARLLPVR